jgi:hypothetical protein
MKFALILSALVLAGSLAAQDPLPLSVADKLLVHAGRTFGPGQLAGSALGAGFGQYQHDPKEWIQGAGGFAKRYASVEGFVGIQNAMAFGVDSLLHEDPRYFHAKRKGFWPRLGHALSQTLLTHTDSGQQRIGAWRIASNYGAAWLANTWQPHRTTTTGDVLMRGSLGVAMDTGTNLGSEFWPDMKALFKKLIHRP